MDQCIILILHFRSFMFNVSLHKHTFVLKIVMMDKLDFGVGKTVFIDRQADPLDLR